MSKDLILGSWRLVSFEYKAEDELLFYPYGKEPNGVIYFAQEGFMATIISRKDRPLLSAADDFIKLTNNEKIRLSKGFIAYSGRYEVITDKIVHYIDVSFFPNWIGTTSEFFYTLKNGHLILSTPLTYLRGREFIGYLTWAKK